MQNQYFFMCGHDAKDTLRRTDSDPARSYISFLLFRGSSHLIANVARTWRVSLLKSVSEFSFILLGINQNRLVFSRSLEIY
jgi:hypothetical protein